MNAIDLLQSQHREIEGLFILIAHAETFGSMRRLIEELADQIVAHAAIEEHQFYPAVKARRTEDIVLESLEEHLGIKRVLVDVLQTRVADETLYAKLKVLKQQVAHHVTEEETDLFPKAKRRLEPYALKALGHMMNAEHIRVTAGHPWQLLLSQTDKAAPLSG